MGGGKESCQWKKKKKKEKPFVAKILARAAWALTVQPPLSFRPTAADDKTPAANYTADGESLKWDCQSKGWPCVCKFDGKLGGGAELQEEGLFCLSR